MNKAEVVEGVSLIADDEPTEVAQPGKEPLNLPAAPLAAQGAAVLGLGAFPVAPVRRDHLDAQLGQRRIERVGIIGAVANEPLRQGIYEP